MKEQLFDLGLALTPSPLRDFAIRKFQLQPQIDRLPKLEWNIVENLGTELLGTAPVIDITKQPGIVAMVGLVGNRVSRFADILAQQWPAAVVNGNVVRRRQQVLGSSYEYTNLISWLVAEQLLHRGRNVILDSDHVQLKKRVALQAMMSEGSLSPRIRYVEVTCPQDVAYASIVTWLFPGESGDFWKHASSEALGQPPVEHARTVMLRERSRRTPLHYRWSSEGSGTWIPRNFTFVHHRVQGEFWTPNLLARATEIVSSL